MFIDDTTKKLADEVLDMAKTGIVEVWTKLQQVAPELWKLVVRQVFIDGIECFIGAFFALLLGAYGIFAVRHSIKDSTDSDDGEVFAITGIVAVIACLVLFPIFLVNGLDYALNPSYWALKDILNMLHK